MLVRLNQPTLSTSPEQSRLVCILAELTASKLSSAERNLALHLSRLIGLSDSIALARGLRHLPDHVGESKVDNINTVQEDVLSSRERMMHVITGSFAPESELALIHVPSSSAGIRAEALLSYQPYQRFYATHQVEMGAGIQSLRLRVRERLAGVSPEMHQLAELDKIVDESLAIHTRKLFNVTPKLLEQRFDQLLAEHLEQKTANGDEDSSQWLLPSGWLNLFYQDMRELLLAEFDVRLQPVLGLLEALNEQTSNTTS